MKYVNLAEKIRIKIKFVFVKMERVYRADLTLHNTVPVPPHEGPGPPAGPGEERARGARGGGGGAPALPQPGAQHGGRGEDGVLRPGEGGGSNPLYWRIIFYI